MSFVAQFPGECSDCGGRIQPGDELTYRTPNSSDGPVHVQCPEGSSLFDRPDAPLCGSCFTYHRGECI